MVGPCSLCNRADKRRRLRTGMQLPRALATTEAAFDSRCPGCGGFINSGEEIYRFDPAEPFVCESCAIEEM